MPNCKYFRNDMAHYKRKSLGLGHLPDFLLDKAGYSGIVEFIEYCNGVKVMKRILNKSSQTFPP